MAKNHVKICATYSSLRCCRLVAASVQSSEVVVVALGSEVD